MANEQEEHVPVLSVTVLNYNYAHYLPQCLDSILSQTFTDFELILINDRSTDNSLEVIQPYLADPRIRFINHEQNKGYIASLIEGSESSRGKYITVISADDYCVSDRAFETLLQMMEADPEVAYAHSAFGIYRSDGIRVQGAQHHNESYARPGMQEYADLLLRRSYALHSGVIIRSTAYHAVGGYDPKTRYSCDTLMWLMLCSQGKVAYSHDELFAYRRHESNMSFSPGGVRNGLAEHIAAINRTFPMMQAYPGITPHLYKKAMKRNLTANAEEALYAGHVRAGCYAFWCAITMHPVLTVFQLRTAIIVARVALGAWGFHALHQLARTISSYIVRMKPDTVRYVG